MIQIEILVGNVMDMSLGLGNVLKSQGKNWMASHIFADFAYSCVCNVSLESATCLLFHLEQNKLLNQPKLLISCSEDKFDSSV